MRLLMILLLLGSMLFADHDREEAHEKYEKEAKIHERMHMPMDLRYLGLNDRQLKDAKKAIRTFLKAYRSYHRQKEADEKRLSQLFVQERFDKDSFMRLSLKQRSQAARIETAFFEQMHRILTPTQRKRFIRYMEEWEIE